MTEDTLIPPPLPEPPSTAPTPGALPWEEPSIGRVEGLFRTIGLFVTRPDDAFSRLAPAGLGRPFVYALIMAWVELAAGMAYWAAAQSPFMVMGFPELQDALAEAAVGTGVMVAIGVGLFVLMPLFLVIGLAIHTCILHLMLLIVGEGRGGIETTARVICYSHTADLANLVPLCGGLLSLVWFAALQIIGIARAHRCSYGKAALAVILPVLLCCSCLAITLSFFGAALYGALAGR
jgi:hypothetical protein